MNSPTSTSRARREFLKILAASPYVAALGGVTAFLERTALAREILQGELKTAMGNCGTRTIADITGACRHA